MRVRVCAAAGVPGVLCVCQCVCVCVCVCCVWRRPGTGASAKGWVVVNQQLCRREAARTCTEHELRTTENGRLQ